MSRPTHYELRSRYGHVVMAYDNRDRALSAMMARGVPCKVVCVTRIETEVGSTIPAASSVTPQKAQPTARVEAARGVKGRSHVWKRRR
jgi:hypothetical protein